MKPLPFVLSFCLMFANASKKKIVLDDRSAKIADGNFAAVTTTSAPINPIAGRKNVPDGKFAFTTAPRKIAPPKTTTAPSKDAAPIPGESNVPDGNFAFTTTTTAPPKGTAPIPGESNVPDGNFAFTTTTTTTTTAPAKDAAPIPGESNVPDGNFALTTTTTTTTTAPPKGAAPIPGESNVPDGNFALTTAETAERLTAPSAMEEIATPEPQEDLEVVADGNFAITEPAELMTAPSIMEELATIEPPLELGVVADGNFAGILSTMGIQLATEPREYDQYVPNGNFALGITTPVPLEPQTEPPPVMITARAEAYIPVINNFMTPVFYEAQTIPQPVFEIATSRSEPPQALIVNANFAVRFSPAPVLIEAAMTAPMPVLQAVTPLPSGQDEAVTTQGPQLVEAPTLAAGGNLALAITPPTSLNNAENAVTASSDTVGAMSVGLTSVTPSATSTVNVTTPALTTSSTSAPSGLGLNQMSSLLDSILTGYNVNIRPRSDQTRFVRIITDFVPLSIIEFDTQTQLFAVMGYFKMDWRDEFLTWTPADYADTETVKLSTKSIWIPKLTIDKSYSGNGVVGEKTTDVALIHYRGYVQWFPEGTYSIVCQVNIEHYPFDAQTCRFTYYVADEDTTTINLKHAGSVDMSEYIDNAEWDLTSLTMETRVDNNVTYYDYVFQVERRSGFAMFTLVVPILLLSLLSGATFIIPVESGEKVGFSVTIFLAYVIFDTIIIDTLPHNSLNVSYCILYISSLMLVSVGLTFYTILQAKLFDQLGTKECCIRLRPRRDGVLTWAVFLRQMDAGAFVIFLVLILGVTSTFLSALVERLNIL